MATTPRTVSDRLARVERELADLKARLTSRDPRPWYHQIVGSFEGDADFAEIVRLGRRIRKSRGNKK
ncbi:MAG TPA: hypothetical protein VGF55_30370 [Gemmataceae bacterium]|jgi:hypothetical protein